MRLAFGLVLAAALLAGCTDNSLRNLEARLTPLVGELQSDVVRRMGPPTRISEANGVTRLVYIDVWPVFGGPNFVLQLGDPPTRVCEITFTAEKGRVTGYTLFGQTCGWGGRPEILPY